jgi:asparagine synthase (glutamine-hydrolysing)
VTKRVLRAAMRGIVPDSILDRTDKRGFETPVVRWLATRHAGWLRETLVQGRAVERGFLVRRVVAGLVDELLGRPRGPGHEIWRLLSLELWLRAAYDAGGFARGEARVP